AVDGGEGGGIMGDGVIDGRGGDAMEGKAETWWQLARRAQRERLHQNVPRLVVVDGARDFTLYRITLRDSPNFHVTLHGVDGFTAWGVKIDAPADARNTDGIDPVSSRNVSIVGSFIRTGDDNVAIKAGRDGPSENISIVDNHFYNGHGMSIGSETVGGVRRVLVERLTMEGSTSGLRIKSDVSRGGRVDGVRYSDICLRNVGKPIDIDTRYDRDARGNSVPVYTGLSFERIAVGDSLLEATTQCEGRFVAFPDEAKIAAPVRPQLSDAQARDFSYEEVLGSWDPLSDPLAKGAALPADYVVDASGEKGAFATIQAAVSEAVARAAATGRRDRIHILVRPGRYPGLVYVPASSAPITIHGDGGDASAVRIVADLDAATPGSRYGETFGAQFSKVDPSIASMFASVKERATVGTPGSAVAWIRNAGFQARKLTFENAYNKARGDAVESGSVHSQAVAVMVDDADRVQFENVRFEGFQDTLYLKSSSPSRPARSFFHDSYVEGDMDFIFGEATAYFLATEIRSLGDREVSYLLAPSTHYESRFGFVFRDCAFTHDGKPNALAGSFRLARQWFRGQRCTPYAPVDATPGYACTLGPADAYDARVGTISRASIEAVGKVAILESRIGAHIDKARPWSDWNNRGTLKYRPAQFDSDDYWNHLVRAGIDPVRELGYAARKTPAAPFLAEYRNTHN
ncbi:MAG TPA: pectinesterase family protein, partial [Usitatibacter sp.]